MSSTKATVILAAVILAAAFAGILVSEDSDAEATPGTVTYVMGDAVLPVTVGEDGTVTILGPDDVAAFYEPEQGKEFVYWVTNDATKTIYTFGATVVVPETGLELVPQTVDVTDITFIVDGKEYAVEFTDADSLTIPEEAVRATVKDGMAFDGWKYDGEVYKDLEAIKAIEGLAAGAVFTAQFHESHTVTWIVDGITIAAGTTEDLKMPADPVKEHFVFDGWFDAAGSEYDEKYVFSADTVFTAQFTPVNLTVTFVAGDETVGTSLVPYGETVLAPALPEGYSAWDFDFATPITEDVTIEAVASPASEIFTVTFVVDGEVIATYRSDAVTVPSAPAKEGQDFVGWAIGDYVVRDPAGYTFTADTVFTAQFTEQGPAPEPGFWSTATGMVVAILIGLVVLVVLAIAIMKRDEIRTVLVTKLDKEGKKQ